MTGNPPDLDRSQKPINPLDTRIVELRPETWPDMRRIKVHVTLSIRHPDLDLEAIMYDRQERKVSEVDIIGLPGYKFVFTMHLKEQNPSGVYRLKARLHSQENPRIDEKEIIFELN